MPPQAARETPSRGDPWGLISAHCLVGRIDQRELNVAASATDKERLFNAAVELTDPAQRAAFLDAACGGDARLRAELEELLHHDDAAAGFLSAPALAPAATAHVQPPPKSEEPGTRIGPHK